MDSDINTPQPEMVTIQKKEFFLLALLARETQSSSPDRAFIRTLFKRLNKIDPTIYESDSDLPSNVLPFQADFASDASEDLPKQLELKLHDRTPEVVETLPFVQ